MPIVSRRELLKTAASAAALGAVGSLTTTKVQAAETITAVEWGGAYIDTMRSLVAKQSDVNVNWLLHEGGAMTILPKIKAGWPNPGIDLLAGWDPVWQVIKREGWAEPIPLDKVPNLADVPAKLLVKDAGGNVINIPRAIDYAFWFYRSDITPFEITKIDDLLDPKLKGKICFPVPTLNSNEQMISLALAHGGDERNMEPAWDFVKELARSGNIGRVANADSDITASISSGETCISLQASTGASTLARQVKLRFLNKMEPKTGFGTFVFHEGWCVLKGGHTDAAFKLANFLIDPENCGEFGRAIGAIPANSKAKLSEEMKALALSSTELEKFTYIPDWAYLSEQSDAWMKRWELEVAPLL